MPWSRALMGFVLLTGLLAVVFGCRQEVPPLFRQNRAPETAITVIVEEGTTAFYRYHVFWRGDDADGKVVQYLFAITDTLADDPADRWDPSLAVDRDLGTYTTKTDSVFLFNSGLGKQTLNIVAIDDFGVMDPSPARQFFRVTDNGTPRVVYNSVTTDDPNLLPCLPAAPCTIPMYTDFRTTFSGTTPNGAITGVTWSANLGAYQPFPSSVDTLFLKVPKDTLVIGTTSLGSQDTLWSVSTDTVTVHHYTSRAKPIPSGPFEYRVNVIDDARRKVIRPAGDRLIVVNYDPETRLFEVPECDCPQRPNCDPNKMVAAGWITGINQTPFTMNNPDSLRRWRLFCDGDTLPNLSKVTFYATGQDDPRDGEKVPGNGLAETNYKFKYEFLGPAEAPLRLSNQNISLSRPARMPEDLPIPGGGTFRGSFASWTTCAFDYKFLATAEDEQLRVDGTPAAISYKVGGSPTMDSLRVPSVLVFVPTCDPLWSFTCPNRLQVEMRFAGTDTVPVFGEWIGAPNAITGANRFVFPFKAWAHDHKRDRNPAGQNYYSVDEVGRIRAWSYTFDCTTPLCQDLALTGERSWRKETRLASDPPNQEVFDENLTVTMEVDTLCTSVPCNAGVAISYLKNSRFGLYRFTLQGRDTEPSGTGCTYPENLSSGAGMISLPDVTSQGRMTKAESRNIVWLSYRDLVSAKPRADAVFVNRKRLMK